MWSSSSPRVVQWSWGPRDPLGGPQDQNYYLHSTNMSSSLFIFIFSSVLSGMLWRPHDVWCQNILNVEAGKISLSSIKADIKGTCIPMFSAALFAIARTGKQTKCPSMDKWKKKKWYKHTRLYYSAMKKNSIMPFAATWMDLKTVILSEVSQTEKDKYYILLICGI